MGSGDAGSCDTIRSCGYSGVRGVLIELAITTLIHMLYFFVVLWPGSRNGNGFKAILFHVNGKDVAMKTKLDAVIARVIAPIAVTIAFAVTFVTFAAYWA